jgi:predicted transcriptional regulator
MIHFHDFRYVFTAGADRLLRRFATSKDEADSNAHTVDHTDDVTCLAVAVSEDYLAFTIYAELISCLASLSHFGH